MTRRDKQRTRVGQAGGVEKVWWARNWKLYRAALIGYCDVLFPPTPHRQLAESPCTNVYTRARKTADWSEPRRQVLISNSNEHTHIHTNTELGALSSTPGHEEQQKEEGAEEREEIGKRETDGVWGRTTMASDSGLAVMLLWTISQQAVGAAGTNSNEGKAETMC